MSPVIAMIRPTDPWTLLIVPGAIPRARWNSQYIPKASEMVGLVVGTLDLRQLTKAS